MGSKILCLDTQRENRQKESIVNALWVIFVLFDLKKERIYSSLPIEAMGVPAWFVGHINDIKMDFRLYDYVDEYVMLIRR